MGIKFRRSPRPNALVKDTRRLRMDVTIFVGRPNGHSLLGKYIIQSPSSTTLILRHTDFIISVP